MSNNQLFILGLIALGLFAFTGIDTGTGVKKTNETRTITVTGSADMNVIPDELEFVICIEAPFEPTSQDEKNILNKIQARIIKEIKEIGITTDRITINDLYDYYWWPYERHRQRRSLSVKMKDIPEIETLVNKVGTDGIYNMYLADRKSTKMSQFRKDVRIAAVKAAKEKAQYLLAAMGQTAGGVISITEMPEQPQYDYWWWGGGSNVTSNSSLGTGGGNNSENPSAKNIKLRAEVQVVFEIK